MLYAVVFILGFLGYFRVIIGFRVLGSLMGKEGPREPAAMPGRIIDNTQPDKNYVSISICRILSWNRGYDTDTTYVTRKNT
jgi:hypothetical protein